MNLIEILFPKKQERIKAKETFHMINGYIPVFRSWNGAIYESELVRSAIDSNARHRRKLKITITGGTRSKLLTTLKKAPNRWCTLSQFIYRLSTLLDCENTAFILPSRDEFGEMNGVYTFSPLNWEVVIDDKNDIWVRFTLRDNRKTAEKLMDVGILTRYQKDSDFFGSDNTALDEIMQLISIQRQGIEEYTKNASSYRFMGKLKNFSTANDLKLERERFDKENFASGKGGGMLLFPNTYEDIKQIDVKSYAVPADESKFIKENVYDYFGTNEDVVQNKAYGDAFSAFYEGAVEPFAIQLSEVLTRMVFTQREEGYGSEIIFTSNRVQYMTNSDKLAVSKDLVDRGVLSINEAREIWQLEPIEGGDIHILRGEYYNSTTGDRVEEIDNDEE